MRAKQALQAAVAPSRRPDGGQCLACGCGAARSSRIAVCWRCTVVTGRETLKPAASVAPALATIPPPLPSTPAEQSEAARSLVESARALALGLGLPGSRKRWAGCVCQVSKGSLRLLLSPFSCSQAAPLSVMGLRLVTLPRLSGEGELASRRLPPAVRWASSHTLTEMCSFYPRAARAAPLVCRRRAHLRDSPVAWETCRRRTRSGHPPDVARLVPLRRRLVVGHRHAVQYRDGWDQSLVGRHGGFMFVCATTVELCMM